MSRVSPQRRAARRRQILDGARRCFVRSGFHATSMQDVLIETRLSAGTLYNYFPGKNDLIAAIVTEALDEVTHTFDRLLAGLLPPFDEAVASVFAHESPLDTGLDSAKLLVQVWAEAPHSPFVARQVAQVLSDVRCLFTRLVETYQRQGLITTDIPAGHIADILISIVHGFTVHMALFGESDVTALRAGLRALTGNMSAARTSPGIGSLSSTRWRGTDA